MQQLGPNQEAWLTALESGLYTQGHCQLETATGKYCCLGVAAKIFGCKRRVSHDIIHYDEASAIAPVAVIKALSLRDSTGTIPGVSSLVSMNDAVSKTFAEIATFCRENPSSVFVEPR